jgi:hypothetical protein
MLCIGCDVCPIHLYVAYGCLIVDVTPGIRKVYVINWNRSSFHPTYINISRPTPSAVILYFPPLQKPSKALPYPPCPGPVWLVQAKSLNLLGTWS